MKIHRAHKLYPLARNVASRIDRREKSRSLYSERAHLDEKLTRLTRHIQTDPPVGMSHIL